MSATRIRYIDKRIGLVAIYDGKRDLNYSFYAGKFLVSYKTERKDRHGRHIRMQRELDPTGRKAGEIRALLEAAE